MTDVWAIQLSMRLPKVPVPLLEGDANVKIDLQAAFEAVYDDLGFDLSVDYDEKLRGPDYLPRRGYVGGGVARER